MMEFRAAVLLFSLLYSDAWECKIRWSNETHRSEPFIGHQCGIAPRKRDEPCAIVDATIS